MLTLGVVRTVSAADGALLMRTEAETGVHNVDDVHRKTTAVVRNLRSFNVSEIVRYDE